MTERPLDLTDEETWMVYNLVTAKAESLASVEEKAMQSFGGAPWYALQKKLRRALSADTEAPDA